MERTQTAPVPNPAVRNGLVFGAILAGINIINTLIQWISGSYQAMAQTGSGSGTALGAVSLLGCLAFLVGLALCFLAGMTTVSQTGRLGSGAISGLITGLVGELVGGVLGLILILAFVLPTLHIPADSSMTPAQINALIIGSGIVALIIGLIIDGGIGAGLGYLGGLIGKNSYGGPVQSSQESYYPQPYPPAPQPPYSPPPQLPPQYPPQQAQPTPAALQTAPNPPPQPPQLAPASPPPEAQSQPEQQAQSRPSQPEHEAPSQPLPPEQAYHPPPLPPLQANPPGPAAQPEQEVGPPDPPGPGNSLSSP
jgi:hypothetical protein